MSRGGMNWARNETLRQQEKVREADDLARGALGTRRSLKGSNPPSKKILAECAEVAADLGEEVPEFRTWNAAHAWLKKAKVRRALR